MKKGFKFLGLCLLGLSILGACGGGNSNNTSSSETTASSSVSKEARTIKVSDGENDIEVPVNPSKVVVFDMGALDTIKSLGKEDAVIATAVDSLPAYLESFNGIESAGGIKEPDIEKINELQPDLIIISGRQRDFKEQLETIAPTLYLGVDYTDTWHSTKQNIETLAKIFDEEALAKEKISELETHIDEVKEKAEKSGYKTLVSLVNEGKLSVYGEGSRFGIVHDTFGFALADDKIEASTHGQEASYEYVLENNPDVLFVVDRTKAVGGDDTNTNVTDNELVMETEAGKNNRVISLAPDVWYLSGGGIECTELMLQDVERAFE